MSNFKPTIGIEVHVELKTDNKMFSPSKNNYGSIANTNINTVDLGYPGTLPVLNVEVLKQGIKACKVLNLELSKIMHFDRKNYFYPDNPKNFQITQFNTPIGRNGYVEIIKKNGETKKIYIEEAHIEEDTCKSVHAENYSLLDFNRAGVPLIEIVTKPCINSPEEAVLYLENLRELLLYASVSDCKIEEGSMRCDANVSVSETNELGTKVEVKNIGSISNVGLALQYEIDRQIKDIEEGKKILPETKRFDAKQNKTIHMRYKETGNDYRYFPEPDIPPVILTEGFINEAEASIKTMPNIRRQKYRNASVAEININKIIQNKRISDYLEKFDNINLVIASNLLLGDIEAYLNKKNVTIEDTKLTDNKFIDLVNKLDKGTISNKIFKDILEDIMETDKDIDTILKEKGLVLVNDESEIIKLVESVLSNNQKMVDDYHNGNTNVSKALMGLVMKESHGKVTPAIANKILMEKLNER